MPAISAYPSENLSGQIAAPGDKSLSHRALIFSALAIGRSQITGLLQGDDVLHTAAAMRAFGAGVSDCSATNVYVDGVGIDGLSEPDDVIDLGNSGTGARLLLGLAAAYPFTSIFTGDASLRGRPMNRVLKPLHMMGAQIRARNGGRLPVAICGPEDLLPIQYESPVASAQVKSAILLAGLHAAGETTVIEPAATRDHSERMLRSFGAEVESEILPDGRPAIRLAGQPELQAQQLQIPGDISSAAFPLAAALLCPKSDVRISQVGINPLRCGLLTTLREMQADIEIENEHVSGGEPVADLVVRYSRLKAVTVPAERAPSMIDEFPILAVLAAFAEGETVMHGIGELRVKESDRAAAMVAGLSAQGVDIRADADTMIVNATQRFRQPTNAPVIATHLDHRIAMSFLVFGLAAKRPVTIDSGAMIATSFPNFLDLMQGLGAEIRAEEDAAA